MGSALTNVTTQNFNFEYTIGQRLLIGEGTNPASAFAVQGVTNNSLDGFTLRMNYGSGTVTSLNITGSANFTSTNVGTNGVKVWRDTGTIVGAWDAGDTQISTASSAIAGNTTTVTISSEAVTTTPVNYIVTVDIAAGATVNNTFTGNISGAGGTGFGTPQDKDANSATLTVQNSGVTIGEGTNPANANAGTNNTNNAIDGFTLQMGTGSGTVSSVTVTGNVAFNSTNIGTNGVKVWRDLGTIGVLDGADVQLSTVSTAITGNTSTVTLTASEAVNTTPVNYLVTVDILSTASVGTTITANVLRIAGTGIGTPTDNDANSATLTVVTPTLAIGEGTNPANANAPRSALNNALDGFTLSMNGGSGTVSSITVTGNTAFNATNITANGVKVWRDLGTVGTRDGADVQLSTVSTAITGNTSTVTLTISETVTTTPVNYLVTVDILSTATVGTTITANVARVAGTGIGTPVDSDANSATLSVVAAQNLTIGNGTEPSSVTVFTGSTNNALDSFSMVISAGTGYINTLTLTGSPNFTASNISGINIYRDNATVGTFNGADVLVPTTFVLSGTTATITFATPEPVSAATVSYLVLVDIATGGNDGSFTGWITAVTGNQLSSITNNDTGSATLIKKYGWTTQSCAGCHGYSSAYTDGTSRGTPTGAFVGDHNKHVAKVGYSCSICHVTPSTTTSADYSHQTGTIVLQPGATGIVNGYYDKNGNAVYNAGVDNQFMQTNTPTMATCRSIGCHGGNNPTPQWGVGTAGCVDCHSGIVTALTASVLSGGTTTHRDNAVEEFGLTWGHKRAGRGPVTNSDCIVCHLEGNYSTQKPSALHANGYIDLRDPDGAGETQIMNISSVTFSFVTFTTSYSAGARSSNGHLFNTVDNVLTQKFCLACHDNNGATNPTAVTTSQTGTVPLQYMPFSGIFMGGTYTAVNGAIANGGLVNVKTQFGSTNSSWHPVLGSKNRDYPTAARLADPYKPLGTRGTSGTRTPSVVLNCFDCHNTATRLTNRTVAAHGNAVTIPGILTVTGAAPARTTNQVTFCIVCHIGYDPGTVTDNHNAGSAFTSGTNGGMEVFVMFGCNACHSSGYNTAIVRPIRAQDVHGNDIVRQINTPQTLSGRWAASAGTPAQDNRRPYAFIRNNEILGDHSPRVIGGSTYTPSCDMVNNTPDCSQGVRNYTVGGTY